MPHRGRRRSVDIQVSYNCCLEGLVIDAMSCAARSQSMIWGASLRAPPRCSAPSVAPRFVVQATQELEGTVISTKMQKTIVVSVVRQDFSPASQFYTSSFLDWSSIQSITSAFGDQRKSTPMTKRRSAKRAILSASSQHVPSPRQSTLHLPKC